MYRVFGVLSEFPCGVLEAFGGLVLWKFGVAISYKYGITSYYTFIWSYFLEFCRRLSEDIRDTKNPELRITINSGFGGTLEDYSSSREMETLEAPIARKNLFS